MQKILRRVATAERVAARREKKRADLKAKRKNPDNANLYMQRSGIARELSVAKRAIKDEWKLGPLAPKVDIGDRHHLGTSIHEVRFSAVDAVLPLEKRQERCAWAGGPNRLSIAVNDRVVILEGPDKGRIGKIGEIDHDRATVIIPGLNKANVRSPPHMLAPGQEAEYTLELPLPISAVRLVYPIQDPKTKLHKDVIINQLVATGMVRDRVTGKRRWTRVVPGLNISIPWPVKDEPDTKDFPVDTLRINVEQRTFIPTLLRPPMPETVIDELRNKYSRFRTRHDPEYIARKEAEEQAKKDRSKLMDTIRTPLQELHRQERANKKKKGKPRLTLEMLEEIGKVIAKNRERTLNAAGVEAVSSSSSSSAADAAGSADAESQAVVDGGDVGGSGSSSSSGGGSIPPIPTSEIATTTQEVNNDKPPPPPPASS